MRIDANEALADIDAVLNHKLDHGGSGAVAVHNSLRIACIERWSPPGSSYRRMLEKVDQTPSARSFSEQQTRGILVALRRDYEAGQVKTFEHIVHAALLDSLLDQARELLAAEYKLAATVVVGAVLEEHLRNLASQHSVPLTTEKKDGRHAHKMASELNDLLRKAVPPAYDQVEWRRVQGWIDLRNEGAHSKAEFKNRTALEIEQMVDGVEEFLGHHPA